jgi:hypothetical protein
MTATIPTSYPVNIIDAPSDEHGADCLICNEEDSPCVTNVYAVTEEGDVELLHTCAKLKCIEYAAEYSHHGDDPVLVEFSTLPVGS